MRSRVINHDQLTDPCGLGEGVLLRLQGNTCHMMQGRSLTEMRGNSLQGQAQRGRVKLPKPPAIKIGRFRNGLEQVFNRHVEFDPDLAGKLRRLGQRAIAAGFRLHVLEQAAVVVEVMVKQLRPRSHGEQIKDEYDKLQAIEGDADKLMNEQLRALYHGETDARAVVFWKDVFELLERAVDRCRDAGYVVFHVALKYS